MLSDLRFVIGAAMATAMLAIAAFGISVSVRLAREAKFDSMEASRRLAYADHGDWRPFYDAAGVQEADEAPRLSQADREPSPSHDEMPLIPGSAPVVSPAFNPSDHPNAATRELTAVDAPEVQVVGVEQDAAVNSQPPLANIAPQLTVPTTPETQVAADAAALQTSALVTPAIDAPQAADVVTGSISVVAEIGAGVLNPETDVTSALPKLPVEMGQGLAGDDEVIAIVPPLDEFVLDQNPLPADAQTLRMARTVTPRLKAAANESDAGEARAAAKGVAKPRASAAAKGKDWDEIKPAATIKIGSKVKPAAKAKLARIRGSRVRMLAARMVVAPSSASTGYSITVPAAMARGRIRRVR